MSLSSFWLDTRVLLDVFNAMLRALKLEGGCSLCNQLLFHLDENYGFSLGEVNFRTCVKPRKGVRCALVFPTDKCRDDRFK